MSTSVSNNQQPVEVEISEENMFIQWESIIFKILAYSSPLWGIIPAVIIGQNLIYILYLKGSFQLNSSQIISKQAIIIYLGIIMGSFIYHYVVNTCACYQYKKHLLLTLVPVISILFLPELLYSYPKTQFIIKEVLYSRIPHELFGRSVINWEKQQSQLKKKSSQRILLLGSSQVNLGLQIPDLQKILPDYDIQKRALPGMVGYQYLATLDADNLPASSVVVMYLSEFDFYREDNLRAETLNWTTSYSFIQDCLEKMKPGIVKENRSQLAELLFSKISILWKYRDQYRRTIFYYWWPADKNLLGEFKDFNRDAEVEMKLVTHKPQMTDFNFASFKLFCKKLVDKKSQIIILQGKCRSDRMQKHLLNSRIETDTAIKKIIAELPGRNLYIPEADQFPITDQHFIDQLHLSETSARDYSSWLGNKLKDFLNQ